MLKRKTKKNLWNFIFILYVVILFFFINLFTTGEYEWMIGDGSISSICELPMEDGYFFHAIIPLAMFIPFLFLRKSKANIAILFISVLYYAWRSFLRFYVC
ncbi:DUF2645 family protein [Dickeya fangzhongdai]|uniref:DUF2645 family protein n=1 Tax=Dickeya fangzhongdai TaxID=1778540 RepID=UPI00068C3ADB